MRWSKEGMSHLSPMDQEAVAIGWDFGKVGPEGGHRASCCDPQCLPIGINYQSLEELTSIPRSRCVRLSISLDG